MTKKYSNGEITVLWQPDACVHSTICWRTATGLPDVFNPRVKPWINLEGATTESIVAQVSKCPSGALSFRYNNEPETEEIKPDGGTRIDVLPGGPLLVHGEIIVKNADGVETNHQMATALCRCGASGNKPYCDGSHRRVKFDG